MFLGIQKYFTLALAGALVIAVLGAAYFRASYHSEYAARTQVEAQLTETVASFDAQKRTHAAQLDALYRAQNEAITAAVRLRNNRERILNAPQDQDGAVSPILRCAVTGVCGPSPNNSN